MQVPDTATFIPLTTRTAYILGLIFGDGTIDKNGHYVRIISGDDDVLAIVNVGMGGKLKVTTPKNGRGKYISINSTRLVRQLQCFGLTPDKAWRMSYPVIAVDLQPHFVRGLLDSDGCWGRRRGRRGEHLMFAYISTSRRFVASLRKVLIRQVGVSPRVKVISPTPVASGVCSKSKVRRHYRLAYSHEDSVKIGKWLYGESMGIRCERKFAVWDKTSNTALCVMTRNEVSEAIQRYSSGESIRRLAIHFNKDESGFRKALVAHGVTIRPHGDGLFRISFEKRMEALSRYRAGETALALSIEYGWDHSSMCKWFRKQGEIRVQRMSNKKCE